jgi:putative GTP pyrophosphokinase
LIRKEFQIDLENSIDKRQQTANEFGYRSLHLVSQIDESRLKLTEYKKYSEIKFEIQIRSILQHAWAEIEHDLGYKSKSSLPNNTKRSFNRLAALLESADIEFDRLKKDLEGYKESVENEIIISPQSVPINQASIGSLSLSNPTFVNLREFLTEKYDVEFYEENEFYDYLEVFQLFNINNIKQLQDLIETNLMIFLSL